MKLTDQLILRWADYVIAGNRFTRQSITIRYAEHIGRGYQEAFAPIEIDPDVLVIDKAFGNLYAPLKPVIWKQYIERGPIKVKIPDSGPRTEHYNNLKLARRCWQEAIDRIETPDAITAKV